MTMFNESTAATVQPLTFSNAILGNAWENIAAATQGVETAMQNHAEIYIDSIQYIMDSMRANQNVPMAEFTKGTAVKNQARRDIKDTFTAFANDGLIEQSTANMHASAYWACYIAGEKFNPAAVQDKSKAKVKSGKAKTTSMADLGKALAKALEMARTLKQTETAAALLDMVLEIDPEFTE